MKPLRLALLASTTAAACALGACSSPSWTTPVMGLDRILLSVWGARPDDIFVAGGSLGGPQGPAAFHFDGSKWTELPAKTVTQSSLWWVHGMSSSDVWFAGEQGTILRWNGSAFSPMTSGTTETLYGIWGASSAELWAVGGSPDIDSVALHFDGTAWKPETRLPQNGGAYFKVWGSSASDVFIVGQHGVIWHYDGASWTKMDSGVGDVSLLTVRGRSSSDVYAVGGTGTAVALHYDGAAWRPVAGLDVSMTPGLTGVSVAPTGEVSIVGLAGTKLRLVGGAWIDDSHLPPRSDLHGTWLDGPEDVFGVGGNLNAPVGSPRQGVVAHYGSALATYTP